MVHDFKMFPELTNNQMQFYYLDSPHIQFTEDFDATCVKVHDGDTVSLYNKDLRDFVFSLRIVNIDAPELNVDGGHEARDHLKSIIEGEEVRIIMTPQRTEKWGRLLADVQHDGLMMSEEMLSTNHAVRFDDRHKGKLPNLDKELNIEKWLSKT